MISTYRPSSTVILSDTSFEVDYLLGSVTGSVACDTIILGSYELSCQVFGMTNQTTGLNLASNGNAGILGMAFPSVAAIQSSDGATILANMFNYLDDASRFFAFKLGRQSGSDSTSSFSVGKLDSNFAHDFSDFFFSPVLKAGADAYDYWKLPIQYITINSTILHISPSLIKDSPNAIAVMDTGTTLILGPSADVTAFWKTINSGAGEVARKNPVTDMWEIKCEKAVSVAFALGVGANMKEFPIHPEDVNWAAGGNGTGWCVGGVQANDKVNSGDWLLGDVFLRNVYASHHGDNSTHPPMIGLRSMTDASRALDEFRKNRGLDLSPVSTIEAQGRSAASMHSTLIYAASSGCGFVVGMISTLVFRAIHDKP
ncbi:aspartic peptidase domain-containing protein [Mucidula mucida]|nr:aspartic peptidase domain-containing protein [Mucidula mucida]